MEREYFSVYKLETHKTKDISDLHISFHTLGLLFAFFLAHYISMAYFICASYFFKENEV